MNRIATDILIIGTLVFQGAHTATAAMSEQDAVMIALKSNMHISIAQIDLQTDALTRQAEQAVWYPGISLNATGWYDPLPAKAGVDAAGVTATQIVPGGATLSAGASMGYTYEFPADKYTGFNKYSLRATQPLLNGAWGNAVNDVALRIQRLDHQKFTLQQRLDLASSLATIRNQFWDGYSSMQKVAIARNSMKYSEEQAARAKARYNVGTASAIDTMSAALEVLNTRSALLDATISWSLTRDVLGRALGKSRDSVTLPDSLEITIGDLPDARSLMTGVRAWDPKLAIFEILRSRLEIQIRQQRNDLLPSLNAQADYVIDRTYASPNNAPTYTDNAVVKLIFSYALPYTAKRVTLEKTGLQLRQKMLEQQDYEIEIQNRVNNLLDSWSQEKEKLVIAIMARDLAKVLLDAAVKGYELGTVDRLSLISAQDKYVSSSLGCLQQQISLKKLEILFDELTGTVFKKFGVTIQ